MSSLKDKNLKSWLVEELAKIDAEGLIKAGAPQDEYSPEADAFLDTLLVPDFEYVQTVWQQMFETTKPVSPAKKEALEKIAKLLCKSFSDLLLQELQNLKKNEN